MSTLSPFAYRASLTAESEGFSAACVGLAPLNDVGTPIAGNPGTGDYRLAFQSYWNEANHDCYTKKSDKYNCTNSVRALASIRRWLRSFDQHQLVAVAESIAFGITHSQSNRRRQPSACDVAGVGRAVFR